MHFTQGYIEGILGHVPLPWRRRPPPPADALDGETSFGYATAPSLVRSIGAIDRGVCVISSKKRSTKHSSKVVTKKVNKNHPRHRWRPFDRAPFR